jgi:hypothetical protein
MKPIFAALLCTLLLFSHAQLAHADDDAPQPLTEDLAVFDTLGAFGQPVQVIRGVLRNPTETDAFSRISVRAEIYDPRDMLIGEGFGSAIDACRAAWLPDFALQPGARTGFEVTLERFSSAPLRRIAMFVEAERIDPAPPDDLPPGFTRISDDETIEVEWIDAASFRFASGCERLPFNEWRWSQHDLNSGRTLPTQHPRASFITPALATALRLTAPGDFERAFIRYAPDGDRIVYQDSINNLLSAFVDGRFPRQIHTNLHNRTLQQIIWGADERFIAVYFGGYGDPVLYTTATAEAQRISPAPTSSRPSQIIPGITRDARRAVIAGDFDDGTGYYLIVFNNNFFEKLFDAAPPGNNYPPPLLITDPQSDLVSRIYLALDDESGSPRLMCFNRESRLLTDLAPLPFSLGQGERAGWWLSPDDRTIALGANGVSAGLWTIDLTALPGCGETETFAAASS